MALPEERTYSVKLDGKLINSLDPVLIGNNFQTLKNLKYTESSIKGVLGMTKINSSAIAHTGITNGYHFKTPTESHILFQATEGSTSSIYDLTTAPPGTGTPTELYIESSSAAQGYFSSSPHGEVIYCNGEETLIWGGDVSKCSGFISTNSTETYWYDYSDRINNTLQDDENIATIGQPGSGIDSSTLLMLHVNNNVTDDSPTTPHTVTNNNVTFDGTDMVFGSHSAVFNGTNAYFSMPDDNDFDMSGGTWTIDLRAKFTSVSGFNTLFWQGDEFQHLNFETYNNTLRCIIQTLYDGGVLLTATISINTWYHIAIVEDGNNYYLFLDGVIQDSKSSSIRADNLAFTFYVGHSPTEGKYLTGKIDELRWSNDVKWTSNFDVPTTEYTAGSSATEIYIGSLLPLESFDLYIKTANNQTSTMTVSYWDSSNWVNVGNLSDGTASGGVSLAQTGTVSFDDTKDVAMVRAFNNIVIYWYKVEVTAAAGGTEIYHAKTSHSMQDLKDLWDGSERLCYNMQLFNGTKYQDGTINISEIDYSSANTITTLDISSLGTGAYLLCGFREQLTGLSFVMAGDQVNDTATTITIEYWDGTTWATAGTVIDGTSDGTNTLSKSGTITWAAPQRNEEYKREVSKEVLLYYYKVSWSATLGTTVKIDQIKGVAAQKTFDKYTFSVHGLGRLWLCSGNEALYSAQGTTQVFNGDDSDIVSFGDSLPLTMACTLYSQFGSSLYDVMVFAKETETWILISASDTITRYRVSETIGCIAPLTMKSTHIEGDLAPGLNRNIAIWQGGEGIYMFDGRVPLPIDKDINKYFDRTYSDAINLDKVADSVGFFNEDGTEYHWLFASGESTTLNKELVFDVNRQKWYEIDRGATKLQTGFTAKDTNSAKYIYGGTNTGYIERLNNGTDFDGVTISYEFQTGDMALVDEMLETEIKNIRLLTVSKANSSDITLTHYGDTSTTASSLPNGATSITKSHNKSGYRVNDVKEDVSFKHHVFHSFNVQASNVSEDVGFEPLHMSLGYKISRRK